MNPAAAQNIQTSSDDAVEHFKEMARYPLLKPDEEVELARRVRFLKLRNPKNACTVN